MRGTRNRPREHPKKEEERHMGKVAETSSGTASSNAANITMQLREACTNLAYGLTEGSLASQKLHAEAIASYAKTQNDLEQETAKRSTEAYNEYAKVAQEAHQKESGRQLLAEAYQNYAATLQGLKEDTTRRLTEAYFDLVNKANQVAADSARRSHEQYVDYLKNVQKVYSSVDVESLIAQH